MPRAARKKSESGIYHIMMRGINHQFIFQTPDDYEKFIETVAYYKEKSGYKVYAYCLMGNHVHLLLKVGPEPLEQVMRRICGRFVYWYNKKYQRIGNLFQDRFKSEPVENESYFLTVMRYIHQNPIKAGLVRRLEDYNWSSLNEYLKNAGSTSGLVNVDFALNIFSENERNSAIKLFTEFNKEIKEDKCLDIEEKHRITDAEAREIIKALCKLKNETDLKKLNITTRNKYLKILKEQYGLSIRQIERVTGINRGIIFKA